MAVMCRDKNHGGRRCSLEPQAVQANRDAQGRYYLRQKARTQIADLAADGVPAVTDLDVPVTYHLGHRLDLAQFGEIEDDHSPFTSKPRGALWSAPGALGDDGSVRTPWTNYLHYEAGGVLPKGEKPLPGRPRPGQVLDDGDGPVEVLSYAPRYNGEDDQIVFARPDGEEEAWDLAAGAWAEQFDVGQVGPEHARVSDDFAEQWKEDNGSGFVAQARRDAEQSLTENGSLEGPQALDAVRMLRMLDQAEPSETSLHRGLFVSADERETFLAGVRENGYEVGLGSFTPSQNVARDFAVGVDTDSKWRDHRNAVVIETVGPVKAVDLWPGSDEPEVVSGGQFAYVGERTEPDGTCVVQVRQTFTPTPEVPTPGSVSMPTRGMFPVSAAPGAVVVRADSLADLQALARRYPSSSGGVSFEAMRADGIDAVTLTEGGVNAARSGQGHADPVTKRFSGWDMPSTAWLRPDRIEVGAPAPMGEHPGTSWSDDDLWDRSWDE